MMEKFLETRVPGKLTEVQAAIGELVGG